MNLFNSIIFISGIIICISSAFTQAMQNSSTDSAEKTTLTRQRGLSISCPSLMSKDGTYYNQQTYNKIREQRLFIASQKKSQTNNDDKNEETESEKLKISIPREQKKAPTLKNIKTFALSKNEEEMLYDFHNVIMDDEPEKLLNILNDPQAFAASYKINCTDSRELCNKQNAFGRMSLHAAALTIKHKNATTVYQLLNHGADNHMQDQDGNFPSSIRCNTKWYQNAIKNNHAANIKAQAAIQAQDTIHSCLANLNSIEDAQKAIRPQSKTLQAKLKTADIKNASSTMAVYINNMTDQATANVVTNSTKSKYSKSLQIKLEAARLIDQFNSTAITKFAKTKK